MRRKTAISVTAGAEVASGRAALYELLVTVFRRLPDHDLLEKIGKGDFQHLLVRFSELDNDRLNSGVRLLTAYRSSLQGRAEEEVLTELSVDRTRILRGTGHPDLKPPYEGLYRRRKEMGDSLLEIIRFYRAAGLLPENTNQESADYLLVELDFMKQLCLRERKTWLNNGGLKETITHEETFLKEHLGRWAGDFCLAVEKHGATDFYKGFSLILDGFLMMEKEWLARISRQIR
jgi:TorA maturation chaperone TorD